MENCWNEACLSVEDNNNDGINRAEDFFELCYMANGTLIFNYGINGIHSEYKLYSSFDSLIDVNVPPTEGFISTFTCDNEKFGICKYGIRGEYEGYSMFYIRRTSSNTIKILYKKCDWPIQ